MSSATIISVLTNLFIVFFSSVVLFCSSGPSARIATIGPNELRVDTVFKSLFKATPY